MESTVALPCAPSPCTQSDAVSWEESSKSGNEIQLKLRWIPLLKPNHQGVLPPLQSVLPTEEAKRKANRRSKFRLDIPKFWGNECRETGAFSIYLNLKNICFNHERSIWDKNNAPSWIYIKLNFSKYLPLYSSPVHSYLAYLCSVISSLFRPSSPA